MLNHLAHPMAVPCSTRRSAQAALLVLSLIGGNAAGQMAAHAEASYLRVHLQGITLWATRCDSPLLLDDAVVLAKAGQRDVLIVRFATSLHDASRVSFDWVPADAMRTRCGLLPALPFGGGLALVDPHDKEARVDMTAHGLIFRTDLSPRWPAERELAIARAAAAFSANLWGGL